MSVLPLVMVGIGGFFCLVVVIVLLVIIIKAKNKPTPKPSGTQEIIEEIQQSPPPPLLTNAEVDSVVKEAAANRNVTTFVKTKNLTSTFAREAFDAALGKLKGTQKSNALKKLKSITDKSLLMQCFKYAAASNHVQSLNYLMTLIRNNDGDNYTRLVNAYRFLTAAIPSNFQIPSDSFFRALLNTIKSDGEKVIACTNLVIISRDMAGKWTPGSQTAVSLAAAAQRFIDATAPASSTTGTASRLPPADCPKEYGYLNCTDPEFNAEYSPNTTEVLNKIMKFDPAVPNSIHADQFCCKKTNIKGNLDPEAQKAIKDNAWAFRWFLGAIGIIGGGAFGALVGATGRMFGVVVPVGVTATLELGLELGLEAIIAEMTAKDPIGMYCHGYKGGYRNENSKAIRENVFLKDGQKVSQLIQDKNGCPIVYNTEKAVKYAGQMISAMNKLGTNFKGKIVDGSFEQFDPKNPDKIQCSPGCDRVDKCDPKRGIRACAPNPDNKCYITQTCLQTKAKPATRPRGLR